MLKNFKYFVALVLMMGLFGVVANGQNVTTSSATDGTTPNALAKGTPPLGTYGGSNFDNINLFNGNLSLTFPLASLTGRGGMSAGAVLSYNSKIWRIDRVEDDSGIGGTKAIYFFPTTDDPDPALAQIAPGWTIHAGRLQAKHTSVGVYDYCFDAKGHKDKPNRTTTVLTFTAPDGTEYELRDNIYNGQPLEPLNCQTQSRGKLFHSVDGTAATFVSDTEIFDSFISSSVIPDYPTGYFYLRDGTRFRIVDGQVKQQRDRNGNIIRYEYANSRLTRITDTLGRTITIAYDIPNTIPRVLARVTIKGFGGDVDRVIDVQGEKLKQVSDESLQPTRDLFPNDLIRASIDQTEAKFNPVVVSAVILPSGYQRDNGHTWEFKYNKFAEISRVKTPTLGAIEYDSTSGPDGGVIVQGARGSNAQIFRRIAERRVYPNNNNSLEGKTIYEDPTNKDSDNNVSVLEEHQDADGNRVAATRHKFIGNPLANYGAGLGYKPWLEGKEIEAIEKDFSDGTIRTTKHLYKQREPVAWVRDFNNQPVDGFYLAQPSNDPQLIKTKTILHESNKFSVTNYEYDEFNNVTHEIEHDFANVGNGGDDINSPVAGPIIREVMRTFLKDWNGINYAGLNLSIANMAADTHMRSLLASEMIKKGSTIESTTIYEYDLYGGDAFHSTMVSRPLGTTLSSTWDSSFNGRIYRGNITKVKSGFGNESVSNPNVNADVTTAYSWYDSLGNIVKAIGPRATPGEINRFSTDIEYDNRAFVYPIKTTLHTEYSDGLPLDLSSTRNYDFQTGSLISTTDPNGFTTNYQYQDGDLLDRLTAIIRPQGFGRTDYTYSSPNTYPAYVHQETALDEQAGTKLIVQSDFDGLLRNIQQHRNDPAGEVTTETFYDALGRVNKVQNAHGLSNSYASTNGYATTNYDAVGRVKEIENFDKDGISTGKVISNYQGQITTIADQAGKQRRIEMDALGRIVKVIEPDSSGNLSLETTYQYDARGNLTQVVQGQQQRSFAYDSLGHLISANGPETGTISYIYDRDSNLTKKQDARNIVTTLTYDSLNRVLSRTYSDGTPDVSYFYDSNRGLATNLSVGATLPDQFNPAFAIGRLVAVTTPTTTSQSATGNFYSYDIGGRLDTSFQLLDGQHYRSSANYNEASLPTNWIYPSSSSVDLRYNEAGQIDRVRRNEQIFADSIFYTAAGAVTQQRLGNNLYHSIDYNSRLQPIAIALGGDGNSGGGNGGNGGSDDGGNSAIKAVSKGLLSNVSATNKFLLEYDFGLVTSNEAGATLDQTHNNGNIGRIKITPGQGVAPYEQIFQYDELNRIKSAKEYFDPSPVITAISPSSAEVGETITVQISGSHLADAQSINFSPSNGIGVSITGNTDNLITATLTASAPGYYSVIVTTPLGESNALNFSINNNNPNNQLSLRLQELVGPTTVESTDKTSSVSGQFAGLLPMAGSGGLYVPSTAWLGSVYNLYAAGGGYSTIYNYQLAIINQVFSPAYAEQTDEHSYTYHAFESKVEETAKLHLTVPAYLQRAKLKILHTRDGFMPAGPAVIGVFAYPFGGTTINARMEVFANGANIFTKNLSATGSGTAWGDENHNSIANFVVETLLDEGIDEVSIDPGDYDLEIKITFDMPIYSAASWLYQLQVEPDTLSPIKKELKTDGVVKQDNKSIKLIAPSKFASPSKRVSLPLQRNSNVKIDNKINGQSASYSNNVQSATSWIENYEYDRYGNHLKNPKTGESISVNANNNRLSGAGYDYDNAGNLIKDANANGKKYIYDAENRMIEVQDANNTLIARYTYDANGQRVKKVDLSSNTTTRFIYGGNGKLLAEYEGESVASLSNPTKEYVYGPSGLLATVDGTGTGNETIQYLTPDHLGSPRVITDNNGNVVSRRDFHPFGEEINTDLGGRFGIDGYTSGDSIRQKFTGKERDKETGLDYFGARYYASIQGRWINPDKPLVDQRLEDPQSWNLYNYVRNNPLRYYDEDGFEVKDIRLKKDGSNALPDRKSQEAGKVKELGPRVVVGNFVYSINIEVEVTDDDSPDNYEPYQKAFIILPKGKNDDPNRPGESGKEMLDNPEKDNVTRTGNKLIYLDNPGLLITGAPPASYSGTFAAVFRATVNPKKGTPGKPTDKVLYFGIKLVVKNGNIVEAVAVPITEAEYYQYMGTKPPKPPEEKKKEEEKKKAQPKSN